MPKVTVIVGGSMGCAGIGHARDGDNVACFSHINRRLLQPAKGEDLGAAEILDQGVMV